MLNEKINNIQKLVTITQEGNFIIIKPKQFLSNLTWRDVNEAVRHIGGSWIGKGKESHWEILVEGESKTKTDGLVKNVNKALHEANQSVKEPKTEESLSFHPFQMLQVDKILSMPFQIRQDQEVDLELAESIKQVGIVEPILVRPKESGMFELVAGDRRFHAAKEVGLTQVPCMVRLLSDQEALEIQLIENIQRKDLSDIEKAHWLDRLLKKFPEKYPTQEALAKRIGKDAPWITHHLNLLNQVVFFWIDAEQSSLIPGSFYNFHNLLMVQCVTQIFLCITGKECFLSF
jgi:ParB/RepB/Spo0J family partition protein